MGKSPSQAIKMTSRRVNALEYVVLPTLEAIVQWIKGEMDEIEREEFFRVKKVVEKKKKKELQRKLDNAAHEAEQAALAAKAGKSAPKPANNSSAAAAPSAIGGKDPDIMF